MLEKHLNPPVAQLKVLKTRVYGELPKEQDARKPSLPGVRFIHLT